MRFRSNLNCSIVLWKISFISEEVRSLVGNRISTRRFLRMKINMEGQSINEVSHKWPFGVNLDIFIGNQNVTHIALTSRRILRIEIKYYTIYANTFCFASTSYKKTKTNE